MQNEAIGVFDSGMGGLTVLKALKDIMPNEDYIYLGDTARLPYGTKSPETVIEYARQSTRILQEHRVKCLVVACNTASSVALKALAQQFSPIPVVGVLLPGAKHAATLSQTGTIGVIATEATIRAGGYQKAIKAINKEATVLTQACALFVALAEEGWGDSEVARLTAHTYLSALAQEPDLDCLVLGCTHYPILTKVISEVMGPRVQLVDSAHATATAVLELLKANNMQTASTSLGSENFFVTDLPERFARVAEYFLERPIASKHIEPVRIDANR